jgi:hypothetical protein
MLSTLEKTEHWQTVGSQIYKIHRNFLYSENPSLGNTSGVIAQALYHWKEAGRIIT